MIKMHWPLVYATAIFFDILIAIFEWTGVGVVFNRIIDIFLGLGFALYFYITGTQHWFWRLVAVDSAEETPVLGDFMDLIPIWWTLTIWRIHKKNRAPVAGEAFVENLISKTSAMETGNKEDIIDQQKEEDQLQPV